MKERNHLRILTLIAMFAALSVALRMTFAGIPNVQPITALFLVLLEFYPFAIGWSVMSLSMLITGYLLFFDITVAFQIVGFTLIFIIWKWFVLPLKWNNLTFQMGFRSSVAFCLPFLYGAWFSLPSYWLYHMPVIPYLINNIPFDMAHGISTFVSYPLIHTIFWRIKHHETIY